MRVGFVPVLLATLLVACGDSASTGVVDDDAAADVSVGEDVATTPDEGTVPDSASEDSTASDATPDTTAPADSAPGTDATDGASDVVIDTKPDVIASDVSPSCVNKGGFCTWAAAYRCCSGKCDGDSCLGFDVGHACSSNAQCQLNNCVGGVCACAIGDLPCGAGGACTDIEYNDAHCGSCGKACGPNQRCLMGKCECKDSFTTNCGADCHDTRVEEAHCGGCGKACRADQLCAFSACQCTSGTSECKGACLSFGSDPNNCGVCGKVCPTDHPRCSAGACVCATGLTQCPAGCMDLKTDRANCGTCGNTCNGMKMCVAGVCV